MVTDHKLSARPLIVLFPFDRAIEHTCLFIKKIVQRLKPAMVCDVWGSAGDLSLRYFGM